MECIVVVSCKQRKSFLVDRKVIDYMEYRTLVVINLCFRHLVR